MLLTREMRGALKSVVLALTASEKKGTDVIVCVWQGHNTRLIDDCGRISQR